MTNKLKALIESLPTKSGVYLMKNDKHDIIYVGKAKNLKKRVSQYFLRPQNGKTATMVLNVHSFEVIVTKTEKEAFILEMNLIQKHYPKYNILLKDGKHYPYIALKKRSDLLLKISRNDTDKNYFYFGPYPTSSYAYKVINLLNKVFPTRKCNKIPKKPCLYYHLNQCLAPCINNVTQEQNDELFKRISLFLKGKNSDIIIELENKMKKYSDRLQFENANEIKIIIDSIKHINESQSVEMAQNISRDVFAYSIREGYLALGVLSYRNGMLLGKDVHIVEVFGEVNEQIENLILQYYQSHNLPKEILINIDMIKQSIEQIYNVKVISVKKGNLLSLIELASLNAKEELDLHFNTARLNDDAILLLDELSSLLKIDKAYRIELFDNSHNQGDAYVGAMVCFINGAPCKKMYRKFNINSTSKSDDVSSMKEIIFRRYKRVLEENDQLPDVIFVDGSIQQVNAAICSLELLNVSIPVFGLYKNDKHRTSGLIDKDGNKYSLEDNKKLFFLLVRMQDEIHRYVLNFHKNKMKNRMYASIFSKVNGIGLKRQEMLTLRYPTSDLLKEASINELSQIIPQKLAENLFDLLHKDEK